ncbi:heterogeneous nuclear ribonucleoprotein 1-like isoform X2 [Wolffia australiana]
MESDLGKLFIGGISWDTNEDRLKEYFSNYGEVVEAVIMKDRTTGRARGFGFVVFSDPAVAERVVMEKHIIDGRMVEAKKAVPRQDQQTPTRTNSPAIHGSPNPGRTRKIFVGGLASTVTESDFRAYFEQFGTITDVVVMYDHNTQRPRGFGFITYDSEDAVDNVLVKTFHELNGKMVEVKRAVPKEQSPGSPLRSVTGYNYNMNRLSTFLNGYNYGPGPITGYGLRLGQPNNPRARFNPGYGIGLNFDQGLTHGRGINQIYTGNSEKFGGGELYGGVNNSAGSVLSSVARGSWGNGGLQQASVNSENSFMGAAGSLMLGELGNGGVNWGDSSSLGGSLGLGFGRRNRGGDVGYNNGSGSYSDLYGGSSIYGDPTWRSSSLELEGSNNPFDYGFGSGNPSSDGYVGSFNIRQ